MDAQHKEKGPNGTDIGDGYAGPPWGNHPDKPGKRFLCLWFCHLKTDWMLRHRPGLENVPFVLTVPDHGRMRITEVSAAAKRKGIETGMVLADAKVILPSLQPFDDSEGLSEKLLQKLCLWCIRYTPAAAMDPPDGLTLEISGCPHLWGGEETYLKEITVKLKNLGYHIRAAIADTIGTAWAVCRYGKTNTIVPPCHQTNALMPLPPASLRLEHDIVERLHKLGLYQISSFAGIQRSALRRRFGQQILRRLDQALGTEEEFIAPLIPAVPYSERLPCLEAIQTNTGIEIALQQLLIKLCSRLQREGKGLRMAMLKCFRLDGKIEQIAISTNHPSNNIDHLFRLFSLKICTIEPGLGIELFILEAPKVEDIRILQETLWSGNGHLESKALTELLDRLESKLGGNTVHRYLPDQHHLPEVSIRPAASLDENPSIAWRDDRPRPVHLLKEPEKIEVTAPIPDYPPMNFRYNGQLHTIKKADGPERIEPEWWLRPGLHRDYYIVEDENGKRYWLFRLGHYDDNKKPLWFIHGFFP